MVIRFFLLLTPLFVGIVNSLILTAQTCEQEEGNCQLLTLTSAIARALKHNRQLLGNSEAVTTAQYGLDVANSEFNIQIEPNSRAGYVGGGRAGTGFSVGGGLDFSKKFITGTRVSLGPSILKMPDHYHTEFKAVVSQPLLRGLGKEYQLSGILGAQFNLRSAMRSLYMAQIQIIVRTVQALYEVVKAEKTLLLHQESVERMSQFYRAAKLKEKIGMSDALDVYRAETELRHAEDGLRNAQERFQEAEDGLRDLLALSLDACIRVEVPLIYTPNPIGMQEAVEMALKHRIEVEQAEDQWRENERLARLSKKKLYPELNLVLDYTNCGRNEVFTRSCTHRRESKWGVGFTTSSDFDPVAEQMAYEQSKLAVNAALRGIDQTKANLILETKKAFRQLERSHQRIHLQEDQIRTAQGELALAKLKFDRGMADNFNVIQAEKALRTAEQAYWSALIEHVVGEFQLLYAMGLLIDKPRIFQYDTLY